MNLILKVIHKVHSYFGQNPNLSRNNKANIDLLKDKVFSKEKNNIKKIRKANETFRLLIEKGDIQVRIIR